MMPILKYVIADAAVASVADAAADVANTATNGLDADINAGAIIVVYIYIYNIAINVLIWS